MLYTKGMKANFIMWRFKIYILHIILLWELNKDG